MNMHLEEMQDKEYGSDTKFYAIYCILNFIPICNMGFLVSFDLQTIGRHMYSVTEYMLSYSYIKMRVHFVCLFFCKFYVKNRSLRTTCKYIFI